MAGTVAIRLLLNCSEAFQTISVFGTILLEISRFQLQSMAYDAYGQP